MKKFTLIALSALCAVSVMAQDKVMRIYMNNGQVQTTRLADIEKVAFETEELAPWPEDPNPPMQGYLNAEMKVGELMYYGRANDNCPEDGAIYFLYLKDLDNANIATSLGFYVNVKRQQAGGYYLPEGTYTAANTWAVNTFNDSKTSQFHSFWNVINPKWVQYQVEAGEFTVEMLDANTYRIRGRVKGGSLDDNNVLGVNQAGLEFSYTGLLPVEDYSPDYDIPWNPETPDTPDPDDPDGPDTPDNPADPDAVTLNTGLYYYYGDNEYYVNLKDQQPRDKYEVALYLYCDSEGSPQLASGTYTASDTEADMTMGLKSSWTEIDPVYNDVVRTTIEDGSVTIKNLGDHEYEISGKLSKGDDSFSFTFTGTLPFEDYSY